MAKEKIICSTCGAPFHGLSECPPPKPKPWTERVDAVLADPEAMRIAAMLYYLAAQHVNGPIKRKRVDAVDQLWDEAHRCMEFVKKESR